MRAGGEATEGGDESLEAELLALALSAAADAGEMLAERFHAGREHALRTKSSPTDLVSEADIDAERLISRRLSEERPEDGLLGEEGSRREGSSGLEWVVDPLDGTVNFLLGIPQWCVSVAVRDEAGALAGAIFDPIRGEMFTATRRGPAAMRTGRQDAPPQTLVARERADLGSAMVATGLAYSAEVRAAQGEVLARLLPRVRDIRRFGSAALDLAWTAAGRYDAYFERSVKPWDVEAGVLICSRAGLRVAELPPAGVLPWGVLACGDSLAEPLLEIVA